MTPNDPIPDLWQHLAHHKPADYSNHNKAILSPIGSFRSLILHSNVNWNKMNNKNICLVGMSRCLFGSFDVIILSSWLFHKSTIRMNKNIE